MAGANTERSDGGFCFQYFSSVLFLSSSWYQFSQYLFYLSAIFVQLQSDFRQSLTEYMADVAETLESLIWLSERAAWNFILHLLLSVPHTHAFQMLLFIHCELSLYLSLLFLILILIFAFCFSFFWLLRKCHQISIFFNLTDPIVYLTTSSRTIFCGITTSCAASNSVNLLVTCIANCAAFFSLSFSTFGGGMLLFLSFSPSLLFIQSPQAIRDLCLSLLLGICNNSFSLFSIFVQLRCSLSDSRCRHQERSRYIATWDAVWTEPTCALSRVF